MGGIDREGDIPGIDSEKVIATGSMEERVDE